MAARTLLMDVQTGQWSKPLCDLFNIPEQILPEICTSCNLDLELNNGTVLTASVSDQSAALLSSISTDDNDVLVNLGTGGFVVRNVAESRTYETGHYLRTLVYQDRCKNSHMAIEGTLNSIALALQPYPYQSCNIEDLAYFADIYCLAEPSGLGAPYFRTDIGLEFSQPVDLLSKQQIAGLLLEGIIFRVALILEEFNRQQEIQRVYLSGGLSALPVLQQGIALCSPAPVGIIRQKHSGLQGIANLANQMPIKRNKHFEKILIQYQSSALVEKYLRWKDWFEQLIFT